MARIAKAKKAAPEEAAAAVSTGPISLAGLMSRRSMFSVARFWIVGDTPLITHAWSEKAKREMLEKQIGAVRAAREKRDPKADFVSSLYDMGPQPDPVVKSEKVSSRLGGVHEIVVANTEQKDGPSGFYGFPVTGVKNCLLAAAHKDKGIARSAVMASLFLDAEMVRVRPALAGAICDMPLVRIWAGPPEMREDMVKIGSGLNKVASLAYRGQFTHWALKISGKFNPKVISAEALAFLVEESGLACGIGEWRNERKGVFGAFHLATQDEEKNWEAYAAGKGPLPVSEAYKIAAE